jgi:hypothetical protein
MTFYIIEFQESEGILLEKENIGLNPAKRGLAKLCLNLMWGKLTERNNRTRKKKITDPKELYRFLATPSFELAALVFASDVFVWNHGGISPTKKCLIFAILMTL